MGKIQGIITIYLEYLSKQKRLNEKTLKAYRLDLKQYMNYVEEHADSFFYTKRTIEGYIETLCQKNKPKTIKRKVTSIRVFFEYLTLKEMIESNPFNDLHFEIEEKSAVIPKTIPLNYIEKLFSIMYEQKNHPKTERERRYTIRSIAIVQLLFTTGIRVSELCNLTPNDIDFRKKSIFISVKGTGERQLQIDNDEVFLALKEYRNEFQSEIKETNIFFVNGLGRGCSENFIYRTIRKYVKIFSTELHITPHMFRSSLAKSLLEEKMDIRDVQQLLGHSSVKVTETYVSTKKLEESIVKVPNITRRN